MYIRSKDNQMKKLILILLLIFISNSAFAQTVENLKTFKEVATFLEKEISKEYTFDTIFEGEDEIDTEDFNEVVQKVDLDADGDTDLVIDYIGDMIFILNKGNNKYEEIKMLEDQIFSFTSIEKIKGKTLIIHKTELSNFETRDLEKVITAEKNKKIEIIRDIKFYVDTLEVKYGVFLQHNKKKQKIKNEIKEIHFEATACYGSCPVFELKIPSNGNLEYFGKRFTNFQGRKKLKLSSEEIETLFGLIEYTDVKNLKDRYAINATDNPSAILKVTFKNGDVKEIYDYGRFGTYNLRVIYKKLLEISKSIK